MLPQNSPTPIEMYLRDDQDIWAITEAILTAITRREVYDNLSGLWSESELLVDWLLTRSALTPVLKKIPTCLNFHSNRQIHPDEAVCQLNENIGRLLPTTWRSCSG